MTLGAPTQERHGGVEVDPPVASPPDARPPDREPRIGLLEQPGIWSRLRESVRTGELLPGFDPRSLRTREWRAAGVLALAGHAAVFVAIAVVGWTALTSPRTTITRVTPIGPGEFVRERPDDPAAGASDAGGDAGSKGAPAGGSSGGGKNDPTPASAGAPPRPTPTPPLIPPRPDTPLKPVALPVAETVQGPEIPAVATNLPTGLPTPDAPPAIPSSGGGDGGGVGEGRGPGVGNNSGPGARTGNGDGTGTGNGPNGANRPGGTPGGTGGPNGVPDGAGTGVAPVNRGPRILTPVKGRPTAAMLENGTTGTVRLKVTIGPAGEVLNIVPVQPLPNGGTDVAIAAVRQCRFAPAIRNGVAVTETVVVTVPFDRR